VKKRFSEEQLIDFQRISCELERIHLLREQTTLEAFGALQLSHVSLAELLLSEFPDRRREAHWMAQHHRAFSGRTAYQVLAERDEGAVRDELERTGHLVLLTEPSTVRSGIYSKRAAAAKHARQRTYVSALLRCRPILSYLST